jgi:hypothetical protein
LIHIVLRLVFPVAQQSFIHRFWSQINILVDLPRQNCVASSANAMTPIKGNLRYFSGSLVRFVVSAIGFLLKQ